MVAVQVVQFRELLIKTCQLYVVCYISSVLFVVSIKGMHLILLVHEYDVLSNSSWHDWVCCVLSSMLVSLQL